MPARHSPVSAVSPARRANELEEVLSLADRILVMYEGRIVGEFAPDVGEEELGFAMLGGTTDEVAA